MPSSIDEVTATSSPVRGVMFGGQDPSKTNEINYVTIASTGNAVDFGDMTISTRQLGGMSTETRGLHVGGFPFTDTIGYVTIASTGNAADYGDLVATVGASSYSSDSHGGLQSS